MKRILVTGATGTVGTEVIKALLQTNATTQIVAGVRTANSNAHFPKAAHLSVVPFDFENGETQRAALQNTDVLFLLRPPHLADVNRYFKPLIQQAKSSGIKHIVFLSVQGADKVRFIPHAKIERLIRESGLPFTFLRPAYFMQNFTTTLKNDLVQKNRIFLPAGKALFTVVDVEDIGRAAAVVLRNCDQFVNKAFDLTATEKYTFHQMAEIFSRQLHRHIKYISPDLLSFYRVKKSEGVPAGFILVMIMLHYLPRFQAAPPVSNSISELTGRAPNSFQQFIEREKEKLQ